MEDDQQKSRQPMDLTFSLATSEDASALAALHGAVAERLTREHGRGHWSSGIPEAGVLRSLSATSRVVVAREGEEIVATLRLATKKPWAIDPSYFTPIRRPLHLLDMAVTPERQRRGIGRRLLDHAIGIARDWPADALRLDAYDGPAGAGGFYGRCGFRETGRVTYRSTPLIYFELLLAKE
jgi:GNAT superfamily N-acetyltransferase